MALMGYFVNVKLHMCFVLLCLCSWNNWRDTHSRLGCTSHHHLSVWLYHSEDKNKKNKNYTSIKIIILLSFIFIPLIFSQYPMPTK